MDHDHNNDFDERGVVKDGVGAAFELQAAARAVAVITALLSLITPISVLLISALIARIRNK